MKTSHYFPDKTVWLRPSRAPWVTHRATRLMQQRDGDLYRRLRSKVTSGMRVVKNCYPSLLQHLSRANIIQWYNFSRNNTQHSSLSSISNLSSEGEVKQIGAHFANVPQWLPPADTCHTDLPPCPLLHDVT